MAALAMGALAAPACRGDGEAHTTSLVTDAAFPAAMAPLDDGGLLYGERETGQIRRVSADGTVLREPIASVEVVAAGQRGLLGVAADGDHVFAAWTEPDGRITVAEVAPGPIRPIWIGPQSADLANGGRLAVDADGRLIIGIGDLQQPDRVGDPSTPNGKLLLLDARAGPEQSPEVISGGWNNPFAFALTNEGELWVADNAPGEEPERLTRGDVTAAVTALPANTAPSGLAVTADGDLLVCGYVSGALLRYRIEDDEAVLDRRLADDCRLGVAVLADGRIAYATETEIRLVG
jgi:glucose/arabinose dehydrogenase